jgi:hypothetical protein
MIYCDGERGMFDEDEFLHQKDGKLFRPYIHRQKEHIPEHFADGGYPVVFKDQEAAPGLLTLRDSYSPPMSVAYHSLLTDDNDWRELQRSLAPNIQGQKSEIDLHFSKLDWPSPVEIASGDSKADTTKALYQAQLQLINTQQQGLIDHDKAVRASDYAFHQAVFQAYLDVAKGQIDRSVTRTQFLTTAASAIGTIYAAIIGLSFGLGQPNHTLPAVGIAPAIFLGVSIALAAYYLAYITSQTHLLNQTITAKTLQHAPILPIQRLFDERNHLIEWVAETVVSRVQWLHAAVISLAIGVIFLPIPFVALPGWLIWLGVGVGIFAVFIPFAQYFRKMRQTTTAP